MSAGRLYATEAIVLRSQVLGEGDRLVTLLSPTEGKIRAAARGARRGRSSLAVLTQPFVHGRYSFYRGRDLDSVRQGEIIEAHLGLQKDLSAMAVATFLAELLDYTSAARQPADALFDLMVVALRELERPGAEPRDHQKLLLAMELQLCEALGFRPRLDVCIRCGRAGSGRGGPAESFSLWLLSPAEGGLLCRQCAAGSGGVWLGAPERQALRHLLEAPLSRARLLELSPGSLAALTLAVRMYTDFYVNHKLRSLPFLVSTLGLPEPLLAQEGTGRERAGGVDGTRARNGPDGDEQDEQRRSPGAGLPERLGNVDRS